LAQLHRFLEQAAAAGALVEVLARHFHEATPQVTEELTVALGQTGVPAILLLSRPLQLTANLRHSDTLYLFGASVSSFAGHHALEIRQREAAMASRSAINAQAARVR